MPKSKNKLQRAVATKPSKKRLRIPSSDDEYVPDRQVNVESRGAAGSSHGSSKSSTSHSLIGKKIKKEEKGEKEKFRHESDLRKLKQKFIKTSADKKKLLEKLTSKRAQLISEREKVTASEVKVTKLRKDLVKLRKSNEKLAKEKEDAVKEVKDEASKLKKKLESIKQKHANLELENAKLESKLSSLSLSVGQNEDGAGPSKGSSGSGLFQDMMDNFKELAETQLQCAVCSEVFVEATSINCGHTFCHYCIHQWKKKKSNCPVCRTDIKQIVGCKVIDEYTDKMYEQFVGEGGKVARQSLKEERIKIRKDEEREKETRNQERRARAERRRVNNDVFSDDEDVNEDNLEMVNIVLNRTRRLERDEESVDSDATLELDIGAITDTDSEVDIVPRLLARNRDMFLDDSDTDSDDEDFQAGASDNNARDDTDSLTDSTESESSQSSSDSSSDSDDSD